MCSPTWRGNASTSRQRALRRTAGLAAASARKRMGLYRRSSSASTPGADLAPCRPPSTRLSAPAMCGVLACSAAPMRPCTPYDSSLQALRIWQYILHRSSRVALRTETSTYMALDFGPMRGIDTRISASVTSRTLACIVPSSGPMYHREALSQPCGLPAAHSMVNASR